MSRPWEVDRAEAILAVERFGGALNREARAVPGMRDGEWHLMCPICGGTLTVRDQPGDDADLTCRDGCDPEHIRGELDRHTRPLASIAESHTNGSGPANGLPPLRVRQADLSRVKPILWTWERRLPLGYLALLLGAEGIGKGTAAAYIIARLTRGELPGDLSGTPSRVLIVGDEDSFDSVIVPRLYAAGADLELVDTLHDDDEEDLLDVRRDAARLRASLIDGGYRLVYLDALLDVLGVDVDDWRAKAVRDALRPLRRAARDLEVSMLGSLHPNKGARPSFRDLVSGTFAFNASSRSSLLLAPHPDDDTRRVIVRGKGNLSAAPDSFEFSIETRDLEINGHGFNLPVVANPTEGELTVDDVVKPDRPAPVRDTLADQVDELGNGNIQSRADLARALDREPSDRSVGRALEQLENDGRWEKVGRGKWRRIGIGTYREVPMSTNAAEGDVCTCTRPAIGPHADGPFCAICKKLAPAEVVA